LAAPVQSDFLQQVGHSVGVEFSMMLARWASNQFDVDPRVIGDPFVQARPAQQCAPALEIPQREAAIKASVLRYLQSAKAAGGVIRYLFDQTE
jgi:hypothetical protein